MSNPKAELHLYRHAEAAWQGVMRPWLSRGIQGLERQWVVVPTRSQALAWKQRCLEAGMPLLGVEFLTPGLARQKWLAAGLGGAEAKPVLGREFLLHGLRTQIDAALAKLPVDDTARGILETLRSDPETALDDHDALLRAGLGPRGFEWPQVRGVFEGLEQWIESIGCETTVTQVRRALTHPASEIKPIRGRLLIAGLSAETWGEWGNVAALVRCFSDVCVLLPEPEFRGRNQLDEAWVELWERALGCPALPLDVPEPPAHCGDVSDEWIHGDANTAANGKIEVLVGRTRDDEVELAVRRIARWLATGASSIVVVFPAADGTSLRLARLLAGRGIRFNETLGWTGLPPVEAETQRALVRFFSRGCRWAEWFDVWPLLLGQGHVSANLGDLRRLAGRLFDEKQAYEISGYTEMLAAAEDPLSAELRGLFSKVPLQWPAETALEPLVRRVRAVFEALELGVPAGWDALEAFAAKDGRVLATESLWPLMEAFVPADAPGLETGATRGFARVTLTTRKRAEAVPWSHVLLMESNAGVWPRREESSCWLSDETRCGFGKEAATVLGIMTADDRAWLEKVSYASLARNTSEAVVLTAALQSDEDPEAVLAPNAWVERVLWREGLAADGTPSAKSLEQLFQQRAWKAPVGSLDFPERPAWSGAWQSRRDPLVPFDRYFFSADPAKAGVDAIAARVAEAGFQDPAVLWFGAVLGVSQTDWEVLERSRRKWLGQQAHAILAESLKTPAVEGRFGQTPEWPQVRVRVEAGVDALEGRFGSNLYWKSCYAELRAVALKLLEKVAALPHKPFLAVELSLPKETRLALGRAGATVGLRGRVDLVLSDRPGWDGATVEIVDFKTGSDGNLTVQRMQSGHSLQLGLYLAAARGLGVRAGRVTMIRPDESEPKFITLQELDEALTPLERLAEHFSTGVYGALTPEPDAYSRAGFKWPLACAPVSEGVLKRKYALSFGGGETEGAADA